MRLTPREVSSRGGGCDVTCRNALRGFPQVNIPPSSSLQHHYSHSDRLLTSDLASGRHGNSPAGQLYRLVPLAVMQPRTPRRGPRAAVRPVPTVSCNSSNVGVYSVTLRPPVFRKLNTDREANHCYPAGVTEESQLAVARDCRVTLLVQPGE
jgi:hypothetical protein